MRSFSAGHAAAIVAAIDLRQARLVIDVGGGTGELLAAILAAHPDLRGVIFDLPNVADHAAHVLAAHKVADRCTTERGSFFESVPGHGDVYLLKHVIHDWDDERAAEILRCCRRCMPRDARLLLVERKLPEFADRNGPAETFMTDLEMLVMSPGGRERTEGEFRKLLGDAGFKYVRTLPHGFPLVHLRGTSRLAERLRSGEREVSRRSPGRQLSVRASYRVGFGGCRRRSAAG